MASSESNQMRDLTAIHKCIILANKIGVNSGESNGRIFGESQVYNSSQSNGS